MSFRSTSLVPPELLARASSSLKLDLEKGCIEVLLDPERRRQTQSSVVITGDWGPAGSTFKVRKNYEHLLYGDLLPVLRDTDLAITNLESVFLRREAVPIKKDGPSLNLVPKDVDKLSCVPFHVVCLANNHIYDYGSIGVEDTLETLRTTGIAALGGRFFSDEQNGYKEFRLGNANVALFNIAEGEEAYSQQADSRTDSIASVKILESISQANNACDLVIVIAHAGREYLPVPAPYIRDLYRSFVDYGADIVVAHHPHVPQGIEIFKNSPILYSLGNFLFESNFGSIYQSTGFLLKISIANHHLTSLELVPYKISKEGLRRIEGDELHEFSVEMTTLSALINDDSAFESVWHAYSDYWFAKERMDELAICLIPLVSPRRMMLSILKVKANRLKLRSGIQRIVRSILWRVIHYLDPRETREKARNPRPLTYEEVRGASVFRNRLDTLAHRELYLTALDRITSGVIGDTPLWARELIQEWKNKAWPDIS